MRYDSHVLALDPLCKTNGCHTALVFLYSKAPDSQGAAEEETSLGIRAVGSEGEHKLSSAGQGTPAQKVEPNPGTRGRVGKRCCHATGNGGNGLWRPAVAQGCAPQCVRSGAHRVYMKGWHCGSHCSCSQFCELCLDLSQLSKLVLAPPQQLALSEGTSGLSCSGLRLASISLSSQSLVLST